jgi:long-chain acyl-CoA synthetase
MERAMTIYVPLLASVVPHIGEPNQALPALMNEVRPTFVMGVPRTWEKVMAHIQVGVEMASGLSRRLFVLATRVGRRRVNAIWRGARKRADLLTELAYWPLWLAMIWPAVHKLGLTYTRAGFSGGAPLPPLVHETIQAWGIPLRDLYGTTETGCVGAQAARWPAPSDPIVPVSCREVRVVADGELCIRGAGAVTGYWTDEQATSALFDADGFVQTGDICTCDAAGAFRIVDRKKDILITSGGKNIAPATIENALRASAYVNEVIVFGDSRKFITALIEIDFENVAHWARQHGIPYTGFTNLATNERVVDLIGAEIERLNRQLARVEQVKKFRILPKELIPEDGDTTPTRKIKRMHAYKLFGALVEEMYAEDRRAPMPPGAMGPSAAGNSWRARLAG